MRVKQSPEFSNWLGGLTAKERAQVAARIYRIEVHNHFGDCKNLGGGLAELRWNNGKRIYFVKTMDSEGLLILVLLGGMKNAQKKDITQARLLLRKYAHP